MLHETAEELRNPHVRAIRKMEQHLHRNSDGPISVNG
jgi:hypothetical protein